MSENELFFEKKVPLIFRHSETPKADYPIQKIEIDWDRLVAKRALVLKTVQCMPDYLLKPEILYLLDHEKNPTYSLLLDLMWSTGARVSEVLAIRTNSFNDDGYYFGVYLSSLKQRAGRPTKRSAARTPKRYVPISDAALQSRIYSYIKTRRLKSKERLFKLTRQSVNRHLHRLTQRAGGTPFKITCHTFRHSFAIHLLLHGSPIKYISKLLGHSSVKSTEIYTNIFTVDGHHFMEGVDFH